jgi:hypothetical protein
MTGFTQASCQEEGQKSQCFRVGVTAYWCFEHRYGHADPALKIKASVLAPGFFF